MREDNKKRLGKVVQIDERRIQHHLGELVRGTVEEMLNGLLDAEAFRSDPLVQPEPAYAFDQRISW